MLESSEIVERKFAKETHRVIGAVQLQNYGNFFEKFNLTINNFEEKLQNPLFINLKPIHLQIQPREEISLIQLVQSDNKLLSRILISLLSVCNEINLLVKEAKENFFNELVFYGEDQETERNFRNLTKLFELLQKIQLHIRRSQFVICLLVRQLCAVLGKGYYSGSVSTLFPEPLDCLAELLVTLLSFDVLLSSSSVKDHWALYRRTVRAMSHNSSHFNVKYENIRSFDKQLVELEAELLTGAILKNSVDKCLEDSLVVLVKNCNFANEINLFLHQMLGELEKDEDYIFYTQIWLQVNAMFILHYNLNGNIDKKILKRLLEINKKIYACTISGNILWYPEEFLINHIPAVSKQIDIKSYNNQRQQLILQRSRNLLKDSHQICIQACIWGLEVEKIIKYDVSSFNIKQLQETCDLFMDGLKLLKKIHETVKWITNIHADKGTPITKSVLLIVCRLIEILKCFQLIFQRNSLSFTHIILLISQHLTYQAQKNILSIKKGFSQEKNYKEQQLDVLSALVVAERTLKGPSTTERILLAKLALSASGIQQELLGDIRNIIIRIEVTHNLYKILNQLTDCSFLYWHQVLFPIYFSKIISNGADLSNCYFLISALSDSIDLAPKMKLNTEQTIEKYFLTPLNECVETNLRFQTHLHLQLPPLNPFRSIIPSTLKRAFPFLLNTTYIYTKKEVEHYLSTIFYNLTTVILDDWRTYGEMRRLSFLQYGLHTVEDNLPVQTLEQGLDVLEIMRNINVFVTKYMYNLNNQVFVEEYKNNKQLNTINILHIANSIRTHGIGIMSTTVNYIYQFLQNKFLIFSQFMFDEHIKSRLIKDLRFFAENKNDLNHMYPYSRAEKFNSGIRKLGVNENKLSYLDLFRKLITQIGNAMGYVRLIRSGGKRCIAQGTCFLPNIKNIDSIDEIIESEKLSPLTIRAAESLKRDIKNLIDNFEEATAYFKLLVNVFAQSFRVDAQNAHLKNFYIIVPPLTINFVEYILTCKERLHKKNSNGPAFTDDGFAIGLAYIIELLDQDSQLKSLHWFQSVSAKFVQEKKSLEEEKLNTSKDDLKFQQTLLLSEKRINDVEKEFKLLYYNLNSARLFFQT